MNYFVSAKGAGLRGEWETENNGGGTVTLVVGLCVRTISE